MNLAGLEQFHQYKSHDETDSRPFKTSQSSIEHPAQTLAHPTTALKGALNLMPHSTNAHQLGAHINNEGFKDPSRASAQEKILLKATETLRSQQLSS